MNRRVVFAFTLLFVLVISVQVFVNSASSENVVTSASTATALGLDDAYSFQDTGQTAIDLNQGNWSLRVLNLTGLSFSQRLCALTLQGIVNRESQNMIYFVKDRPYERQWIDYYRREFNISVEYFYNLPGLIEATKDSICGYVVYDPAVAGSQFIAATISGLNNSITVSPDMIDMVERDGITKIWICGVNSFRETPLPSMSGVTRISFRSPTMPS
jgi:hypothetical protein